MRVTAETKSATRRRILEVAQKHFAQHGFEVATTRDLAQAAGIAAGTLFNYFPTKEAIVEALVRDAYVRAAEADSSDEGQDESLLAEALFAQVAALLRKLRPFRKYLPAVLDSSFSPAVDQQNGEPSLRAIHLEAVGAILSRHNSDAAGSAMALQLYWTLYTGVLTFWAKDTSPKQEETLALLDESMTMFVGWLENQDQADSDQKRG
jgi:AcrR family transcriptional regulator